MDAPGAEHMNFQNKIDLDEILPQIGEFGKYQKLILWLVCLPACFPCGFCAFNQLFMAEVPDHWCKVSELSQFDAEQRRNISIPFINNTFEKCKRYALNWTELIDVDGKFGNIFPNSSWPTEDCKEGWEYNRSIIQSSIVIDFDLVCNKEIYPTLGLVALNMGGPIGVYSFGRLTDEIGRKKTFFLCLTTLLLGSILTCTAQTFWWWIGSRVIVGLTVPAIYQIPFIISLELVGSNYRSSVTVLTCIFYTLGLMMLSGVTYLIQDWVYLGYATSAPFFLYYFYWLYLPESPRWLLANGRFEEALGVLETLAKTNNKMLPFNFKQDLYQKIYNQHVDSLREENKKDSSCWILFRTPNMRLKTSLITFNWFANEAVYVGLSYYAPALGNNKHLSFLLSSAVEIPSYLACWLFMDKWGRRWPLCICMFVSGLSCMATLLTSSDDLKTISILYLISKSTISASFLIIYPFAGELYPTRVRGLGIGLSAYIAGLGLIIVPFVNHLGSEMKVLPLLIMGIISIAGGLSGLRLPETLHYPLPETVEEGEDFGKEFSLTDCLRCCPIKPNVVVSSYEDLEMVSGILEKPHIKSCDFKIKRKLAQQNMIGHKPSDSALQITYWF